MYCSRLAEASEKCGCCSNRSQLSVLTTEAATPFEIGPAIANTGFMCAEFGQPVSSHWQIDPQFKAFSA